MSNETKINGEGTLQPQQADIKADASLQSATAYSSITTPPVQSGAGATGGQGAQDTIIAQLQAQNAALMAQNEQLNAQVIRMINGGAQLNNAPQTQQPTPPIQPAYVTQAQQLQNLGMQMQPENQFNPHSLSSLPDLSLEGLAGEIGKDRPKH